ncbi:unnamed protein product [Periconia digitata]|uniref:Uncharacterized protein n=1 Tax=Periconia digitata TaxID=1303443 RepID=A0A9W4XLN8_9PLEO|nr:unnamed protein product [Periconia digitata]
MHEYLKYRISLFSMFNPTPTRLSTYRLPTYILNLASPLHFGKGDLVASLPSNFGPAKGGRKLGGKKTCSERKWSWDDSNTVAAHDVVISGTRTTSFSHSSFYFHFLADSHYTLDGIFLSDVSEMRGECASNEKTTSFSAQHLRFICVPASSFVFM